MTRMRATVWSAMTGLLVAVAALLLVWGVDTLAHGAGWADWLMLLSGALTPSWVLGWYFVSEAPAPLFKQILGVSSILVVNAMVYAPLGLVVHATASRATMVRWMWRVAAGIVWIGLMHLALWRGHAFI